LRLWPEQGLPDTPAAWLTTVAQRCAVDALRRTAREAPLPDDIAELPAPDDEAETSADDKLRLILVCCHPALSPGAQTALALRTLCGLSTREIARVLLEAESATAQRLVRAKRKIAEAGIRYALPEPDAMPLRVDAVRQILYLVFTGGYAAAEGDALVREDLCREAIRLTGELRAALPLDAETLGLHALMLLQHARASARTCDAGELVTLAQQDRSRWDHAAIAEGLALLDAAIALRQRGPYQIQAAIAALHAKASDADSTDWAQIAALYGALLQLAPTPAAELNAAVALSMAGYRETSLQLIAALEAGGALRHTHYLYAAKGELLLRDGEMAEAAAAFQQALALCGNAVERAHLARRLATVAP
ncbi:MAG TPA: DUF6596 domain-containing protein, partial [Burkholderiaceae bacterium]